MLAGLQFGMRIQHVNDDGRTGMVITVGSDGSVWTAWVNWAGEPYTHQIVPEALGNYKLVD